MNVIQRPILTRAQLAECGYNHAYTMTDRRLGEIADEYLNRLGYDEHLAESLASIMQDDDNSIPFTAYYIQSIGQLLVYAGTEMVVKVHVPIEEAEDYWQGFRFNDLDFDANISRCEEEDKFYFSIFPVEDGQTQTGLSIPVIFHVIASRFRIGEKVRFTEEAIQHAVKEFGLCQAWAQTHRGKEYIVLDISASPEHDYNVVTVRHSAEDDAQEIAEFNLTNE